MFVLDTDHIAILQWQTQPEYSRLQQRMQRHSPADLYYTIASFHEQVMGANTFINQAHSAQGVQKGYQILEKIQNDYAQMQVLPFDHGASSAFDSLRSQKVRIGTMDLRIAAIALSRNMIVLTRNLADFGRVPGLQVQDWTI